MCLFGCVYFCRNSTVQGSTWKYILASVMNVGFFLYIYKYMYITCILYVPGFMLCLQPGPLSSTAKSKRHEIKSDPTPFGYEGTS